MQNAARMSCSCCPPVAATGEPPGLRLYARLAIIYPLCLKHLDELPRAQAPARSSALEALR